MPHNKRSNNKSLLHPPYLTATPLFTLSPTGSAFTAPSPALWQSDKATALSLLCCIVDIVGFPQRCSPSRPVRQQAALQEFCLRERENQKGGKVTYIGKISAHLIWFLPCIFFTHRVKVCMCVCVWVCF